MSSASLVVRSESASTLASFQRRAPRAVSASTQSAARMPSTLFAAIEAPVPVQQQTMPCSARPSATSRAAASLAQAQSSRSSGASAPWSSGLVAAPAELLDHGLGHARALVRGHRDPHPPEGSLSIVPELPEVEITARRLTQGVAGAEIESALAPGMVTMKTFDPPLDVLAGLELKGVRRVGKMLAIEAGDLAVLVHLMSAGRLQLYDKRASLRDRSSRLLIRIAGDRELRLREFGTQQRAWAKLLPAGQVEADEAVATLGPDALPPPPLEELAALLDQPRHLHPLLRDQRTIAGIGRSWVDEILWTARLSPFQRGVRPRRGGRGAPARGDGRRARRGPRALRGGDRADTCPTSCRCRSRSTAAQGEDCPRCGTTLEAIHFKDYVMSYCPEEQTGGRVLKDRRLSKLLR